MLFKVVWLDDECAEVGEDVFNKQNMGAAIRAAALRIRNSYHLCPNSTYGFYVSWWDETDKALHQRT